MPGPPPIPNERKRLRGNPGHQVLPNPLTVVALPQGARPDDPPATLGVVGGQVWTLVVGHAQSWIAPTDLPLLELLCRAYDTQARRAADIEEQGEVLFHPTRGHYANPLVAMNAKTSTEIVKASSLLGLSPADRSRLGLAEVKAASKLEGIIASRTARGESA